MVVGDGGGRAPVFQPMPFTRDNAAIGRLWDQFSHDPHHYGDPGYVPPDNYPADTVDFQDQEEAYREMESNGAVRVYGGPNSTFDYPGDIKLDPAHGAIIQSLHHDGVSSVDIWDGSHVVLQGDQGDLY